MSTIDLQQAQQIALDLLTEAVGASNEVAISEIHEGESCWAFRYTARSSIETGWIRYTFAGPLPVIVEKRTGRAYFSASDRTLDEQLAYAG